MTITRPVLDGSLSGAELRRWYWLKSELVVLARALGVRTGGAKAELTERVAAVLDGLSEPAGTQRRVHVAGISGDLTRESVIPRGQRCSQALRAYFVSELGPGFHFDAPMREFIATGAGRTLGAAVEFWAGSRDLPPAEIGAQFELNRFQRSWHATHPGAGHGDLLAAWKVYRSLPVDARPDVDDFQAVGPAAAASHADAKS